MLAKLPDDPEIYTMTALGRASLVESLKKGCLSPEKLMLKTGAAVMFTKNNSKGGYVNGTLGVVKDFDSETNLPRVQTRNGRVVAVEPMDWSVEENGKVRAKITQLPLRLAWAITVHKSQGMSMDEAAMDLSDVFEYGQGYVALSRVRRLSGLHIFGWNERTFQVHPEILERDQAFRQASGDAGAAITSLSAEELKEKQNNFITRSGGVLNSKEEKPDASYSVEKIRVNHPQAYAKWTKEAETELTTMYNSEVSIKDIAEKLGRKPGGIISRLKKLGLIAE